MLIFLLFKRRAHFCLRLQKTLLPRCAAAKCLLHCARAAAGTPARSQKLSRCSARLPDSSRDTLALGSNAAVLSSFVALLELAKHRRFHDGRGIKSLRRVDVLS